MKEQELNELQAFGNFSIEPADGAPDASGFQKLGLTRQQKMQVAAVMNNLPTAASAGVLGQSYILRFPDGVQGTLMKLKQGGVNTVLQGSDGKITSTASLYPTSGVAAVFALFSAMSIITAQHYLTQINSALDKIQMSVDRILEFLYGDKKAELISEVAYVRNAFYNYSSIIAHDRQCIAAIMGMRDSQKVAVKDIEFYISDLESMTIARNGTDVEELVKRAVRTKECIDMSIQLYGSSTLLEVFFSQNMDADYTDYVRNELISYLDRCEKRMLSSFSALNAFVLSAKSKIGKPFDRNVLSENIQKIIRSLNEGENSELRKSISSALSGISGSSYYATVTGDVYLKES